MLNQHEINLKQYQNKSLSYLNSTAHSEGVEFDKFILCTRQISQNPYPIRILLS
ncbi:hypothetical protein ACP3QP_18715, partial [Acinetobacter baumannii]